MLKDLTGILMGKTWLTYAGSAWGVLKHAGLWDSDVFDLAGSSGLAFQFVIHETACPSSTTVYDWGAAHFQALDRLGVYSDCLAAAVQPGLNTADELLADAIGRIRAAVDRGMGAVVWAPTPILEFGIVTGYDDEERIFSVIDCTGRRPDPLLYDNLGRSEVPFLYVQRFFTKRPVDGEKMVRDALSHGVRLWSSEHHDRRYGSGPRAYDNLIRTLKAGDFNPFGVGYSLQVYADAKHSLALFLKKAAGVLPGAGPSADRYAAVDKLFREMADAVPFRGPKDTAVDAARIPALVKNLKECKRLENESMEELGRLLGIETPDRA